MKIGIRGGNAKTQKNLYNTTRVSPYKINQYKQLAQKSVEELLKELDTSFAGLSDEEREKRLEIYGTNEPSKKEKRNILLEILLKFANPLVIVLLIIATASIFLDNKIGAYLIYAMAVISVGLSFSQEYKAGKEAEKLSEMVSSTATVYSNGKLKEVKIKEIVPGDIVYLSAGDMIPADLRILSCKDLFINQSSLTGESYPVEKSLESDEVKLKVDLANVAEIPNLLFMGTSVVTGTATAVVIKTGKQTQFGEISQT